MVRKTDLDDLPATKRDIRKLEKRFKGRLSQVMDQIIDLEKMVKGFYQELVVFNSTYKRGETKATNHEKGIGKLEE